MKISTDVELTNEINILDLGIVTAGQTQTYDYWVLNNSNAFL